MTCIDTIELTTKTDYIKSLKSDYFGVSKTTNPNGLKTIKYPLKKKRAGLNSITINQTFETVRINASSKILGTNYPKGINTNTLGQFIDEVSNSGLELDSDFTKDCQLHRIDVKNDLKLEKDINQYINSLNHLNASKFTKTNYESGIVFKEKLKTNHITFTGYSKRYEIEKNRSYHKEFYNIIDHFKNTLRIETKLPQPKTITKYFKSRELLNVLNYSNFNYKILDKVIDNQTKFKPLLNTFKMTNTQEKNFAQIYYLNEYYNGDYHKIVNHIKTKLGKNTKASYQRKKIKEYLSMINNSTNNFFENIEEIKSKLKE